MPARDAFVEPFERFPNVGFALGVDIEVVVELVGERGEVLKLAVEALNARGGMGAGYQPFDGVGVLIEKLDVKADADDGIDAGLGDLILLGRSERLGLFFLRGERRGPEERDDEQRGGDSIVTTSEIRMVTRLRMAAVLRLCGLRIERVRHRLRRPWLDERGSSQGGSGTGATDMTHWGETQTRGIQLEGTRRGRRRMAAGRQIYLLRKTCIMVAFCASVTWARVCWNSGRSSTLLA